MTGGPVEFSLTGSHSGVRAPARSARGSSSDPRTGRPCRRASRSPGSSSPATTASAAPRECTHLPPANGTTACPEARYSFTLVVGEDAADADGDALPDLWEEEGVDTDGDGTIDLDLPAMGADPLHKDIFLEIDHMTGHALEQYAVDIVVAVVRGRAGREPGRDDRASPCTSTTARPRPWTRARARPGARALTATSSAHSDVLGDNVGGDYDWGDVDLLKGLNFRPEREPVFHYAISGHGYGTPTETSSGISRGIQGSDLLVTLGAGCEPARAPTAPSARRSRRAR